MDVCGDNRFELIERCKKDFLEHTNITDEEKEVLDSMVFRMWQLGLLKKIRRRNVNVCAASIHKGFA